MKLGYFLPGYYFIRTRAWLPGRAFTRNLFGLISLHTCYLPQLAVVYYSVYGVNWPDYGLVNLLIRFAFAWLFFISLYEMGYLYNDSITVKHQDNPTYRDLPGYDWRWMMVTRWVFAFIFARPILNWLGTTDAKIYIPTLALGFTWFLHNTVFVKSPYRIYSYAFTQFVKLPFIVYLLTGSAYWGLVTLALDLPLILDGLIRYTDRTNKLPERYYSTKEVTEGYNGGELPQMHDNGLCRHMVISYALCLPVQYYLLPGVEWLLIFNGLIVGAGLWCLMMMNPRVHYILFGSVVLTLWIIERIRGIKHVGEETKMKI